MSKSKSFKTRKQLREEKHGGVAETPAFYEVKKVVRPLRPLTKTQHDYIESINKNTITFAVGSAGTGKTFIAGSMAAEMLLNGDIEKLIITRPGVEAGESFGFLPGELQEKYQPYIEPFIDVLNERLGRSQVDYLLKRGQIVAKPLAYMRGTTFKNSMCILDEAQNTTPAQMMLFLTRIGRDCKVIVDGDINQKDISGISGLQDAVNRLKAVVGVGMVEFGINDCVRSGIVMDILRAYQK